MSNHVSFFHLDHYLPKYERYIIKKNDFLNMSDHKLMSFFNLNLKNIIFIKKKNIF